MCPIIINRNHSNQGKTIAQCTRSPHFVGICPVVFVGNKRTEVLTQGCKQHETDEMQILKRKLSSQQKHWVEHKPPPRPNSRLKFNQAAPNGTNTPIDFRPLNIFRFIYSRSTSYSLRKSLKCPKMCNVNDDKSWIRLFVWIHTKM